MNKFTELAVYSMVLTTLILWFAMFITFWAKGYMKFAENNLIIRAFETILAGFVLMAYARKGWKELRSEFVKDGDVESPL